MCSTACWRTIRSCVHGSTTDTHGFTEQLFGLCFLLGYSFMPRLRDLADQQLYKVDRTLPLGRLQPLVHSGIDLDLIREDVRFTLPPELATIAAAPRR